MIDLDAVAERLYAKSQAATEPAVDQQPAAASEDELQPSDAAEPDVPAQDSDVDATHEDAQSEARDAVHELRAGEPRSLYSRTAEFDGITFDTLFPVDQAVSPDVKRAVQVEFRNIAADIGATPAEVDIFVSKTAAAVREPLSDARLAEMRVQAVRETERQYGSEAPAMLALAQRLVARDPILRESLHRSGLGNDPQIVRMLIERAVDQRARGRLK